MLHSATMNWSAELINAIRHSAADRSTLLADELTGSKEVLSILQGYDYLNESRGDVHRFEIDNSSIVVNSEGRGELVVKYTVEFFYACDAVTTRHPQQMHISFQADLNSREVVLAGPQVPEREPDDV